MAGIVVARFLGKEMYGEYGMIKNTLVSIAIFSTFGLAYTTTKYIAANKNKNPAILNFIIQYSRKVTLIISGSMSILLFVGAGYIADIVLKAPHLAMSLRLVALWVIFNAITSTQVGVLAGFGAFKDMVKVNLYIGIITFILSVLCVYYGSLDGALFALLLSQIVNCYLNYQLINKVNPKTDTQLNNASVKVLKKELIQYSFPIALQEGIYSISSWLMCWLLIFLSGYDELGLYSAASQWTTIVIFIPGILRNVILSHLSETFDNKKHFDKILRRTLGVNLVSVLIPCGIIFLFSGIIASFYGSNFNGLSIIISIAIFSVIPMSLSNVYTQAFLSQNKNWIVLYLKIAVFGLTFILSYFFIIIKLTHSAALSVYISALIANFIHLILLIFFYKTLQIKPEKIY